MRLTDAVPDTVPDKLVSFPRKSSHVVLEARNLNKAFGAKSGSGFFGKATAPHTVASRDMNFEVEKASTLAIVGESGCGKSTLGKIIAGLTSADTGELIFRDTDIARLRVADRKPDVIRDVQMVFQNPDATLNPSRSIYSALRRAVIKLSDVKGASAVEARINELCRLVRLPTDLLKRRPGELSGGQKQRIALARALAGSPALIVADEPVSALDVSVQAAVVNLFVETQKQLGTTVLFVSHDLAVVRYLADRVAVIFRGQIVQMGATEHVYAGPYHPYTELLLSSVPNPEEPLGEEDQVPASVGNAALATVSGCVFAGRCPRKIGAVCDSAAPPEQPITGDMWIRCHLSVEELKTAQLNSAASLRLRTSTQKDASR